MSVHTTDTLSTNDWLALALSCTLVFIFGWAIGHWVLQDFPNSADEFAYIYQAHTLAEGRFSNPAHPRQEYFSPFYIHTHEGKTFSIFPPGWPLFLQSSARLGWMGWVNPLLSACSVPIVFFLAYVLYGRRAAHCASFLLLASPFFLFNAGSFFSHPTCLLLVSMCWLCLVLWEDQEQAILALLAGFTAAFAFLTRELTAVALLTLPVFWIGLSTKQKVQFWFPFLAGAAPVLLFYGFYNHSISGSWYKPARFLLESERLGFGDRRIQVFDYVEIQHFGPLDGLLNTARNLSRLLLWTFPGLPLFALWGAWRNRADVWTRVMIASVFLLIVAYIFYPSDGGNQYGPRFYFEALGLLVILGSSAVACFWEHRRRIAIPTLSLLTIAAVILLFWLGSQTYQTIYDRRSLDRLVDHFRPQNAVILVASPSGDMTQGDLIRNRPGWTQADIIYAWDMGPRNREMIALFPHREFFRFVKSPGSSSYSLERVTSRLGEPQ